MFHQYTPQKILNTYLRAPSLYVALKSPPYKSERLPYKYQNSLSKISRKTYIDFSCSPHYSPKSPPYSNEGHNYKYQRVSMILFWVSSKITTEILSTILKDPFHQTLQCSPYSYQRYFTIHFKGPSLYNWDSISTESYSPTISSIALSTQITKTSLHTSESPPDNHHSAIPLHIN